MARRIFKHFLGFFATIFLLVQSPYLLSAARSYHNGPGPICPLQNHVVCNRAKTLAVAAAAVRRAEALPATTNDPDDMSLEDDHVTNGDVTISSPLINARRRTRRRRRLTGDTLASVWHELECTCAMTLNEAAAKYPSCTQLITTQDAENFAAVSALLLVDAESESRARRWVPHGSALSAIGVIEARFRADLAATYNTNERNIIILRIRCSDKDEDVNAIIAELTSSGTSGSSLGMARYSSRSPAATAPLLSRSQFAGALTRNRAPPKLLTIQFVVLRRSARRSTTTPKGPGDRAEPLQPPFSVETELVDARLAANRVRVAYAQKALAGLRLLEVEEVIELVEVENVTSNSALITQASIAVAFILSTMMCGCCVACRKQRPDEIRKP